jgi:hypothetical protein
MVLGEGRVVPEPDDVVLDPADDDEDDRVRPSDSELDPQAARPADMITAAATAPGTPPSLKPERRTDDLVT